jgi:thioredoxin-related protein
MKNEKIKRIIKDEKCKECELLKKEVKFLKNLVDSLLIQRGASAISMEPEKMEEIKEDPKESNGKDGKVTFGEG